jgi:hypothetical protein
MSNPEITPNDAAIELSDEELNDVAGGFNLQFSGAFSSKQTFTFAQGTSLPGAGTAQTFIQSDSLQAAVIQFAITDATAEDLEALGGLLGGVSALEGGEDSA